MFFPLDIKMYIAGFYSRTKEVIVIITLLVYHVSSRDSSCICSRPSEHSVPAEIVLKRIISLDYDHVCKIAGSEPVVYEIAKEEQDNVADIILCFPSSATNIRGSLHGKILALETRGVDIHTCSCHDRIHVDAFQSVPSSDHVRGKTLRMSVKLNHEDYTLGWVEFTLLNGTHTYHILKDTTRDDQGVSTHHVTHRRLARDAGLNVISVPKEMSQINSCGVTMGCFRYGRSRDCGHLFCDYFISFRSNVSAREVEVEMSGTTDGWLGIGFSSDKQMGGGDDIITCQKKHPQSNDVIIQSYVSVSRHARPEVQSPHYLNLTGTRVSDSHIYCRFTLPFSRPEVNNRRYLDSTNEWFQMYARGPVRMDGMLNKHTETPMVSETKVSLLDHINIYTSCAAVCNFRICFIFNAQILYLLSTFLR